MNLKYLTEDIIFSLLRVLISAVLSWILCLLIGVLLHRYKLLYRIALPVINFIRQISPFVWLPFAIMLIGLGEIPLGIVLLIAMFFPGVIMVYEAIDAFPKDIYEEAVTAGANHLQLILFVELPLLRKNLVNIFRILWSVGWSTVIAAEMLGVKSGLGFRLLDFRYLLEYKSMCVYILIIGTIGIFSDRVISYLGDLSS